MDFFEKKTKNTNIESSHILYFQHFFEKKKSKIKFFQTPYIYKAKTMSTIGFSATVTAKMYFSKMTLRRP